MITVADDMVIKLSLGPPGLARRPGPAGRRGGGGRRGRSEHHHDVSWQVESESLSHRDHRRGEPGGPRAAGGPGSAPDSVVTEYA